MAELHVRNVSAELVAQLRAQAHAEGRSMSAEAAYLLRRALATAEDQDDRQRAAIERLAEIRSRSRLPARAPSSEQLVRSDRDTAR